MGIYEICYFWTKQTFPTPFLRFYFQKGAHHTCDLGALVKGFLTPQILSVYNYNAQLTKVCQ